MIDRKSFALTMVAALFVFYVVIVTIRFGVQA
jgi:hypothetical protein